MEKSGKPSLSVPEWEALIEDFQSSPTLRERWLSQHPAPVLLDAALAALLRRDFPLRPHVLVFLEENSDALFKGAHALAALLDATRAVVQTPSTTEPTASAVLLKDQAISAATSVFITADALSVSPRHLEGLVELLLAIVNRPNHGPDRQTRAAACECLRQLELVYPCLLSEATPHLWALCQNERTHASQSYILLLTTVVHNIIRYRSGVPILATSLPLIPFNIPHSLLSAAAENSGSAGDSGSSGSSSSKDLNVKELRRVVAFLLETPQVLTPFGMMEFMDMIMEVGSTLELQASLLKVQFSGLLYSYDPILSHVVLTLYSRFPDAFEGQEADIASRLVLKSKEFQQPLVFRLLALHWLLGLPVKQDSVKRRVVSELWSCYYPDVFDPLSLKALKLGLIAYVANCTEISKSLALRVEGGDLKVSVDKLFEDGLISVSGFKWLPPWSAETMLAFWMLHKLLVAAAPHSGSDVSDTETLIYSTIFRTVQNFLVDTTLEFHRLVPVIVSFIDRLLSCHSHHWLGERLLQRIDECLLPKLVSSTQLSSYFPIFNRIAQNESIPPAGLLELLTAFVVTLVKSHGPDSGLKLWSHGSKVLGVCRTMLMHHHSSRIFVLLSRLLSFTCQFFPDLEIRDNARIYLRMLLCIPGRKLRHLLKLGEQHPDVSPSPHLGSFFQVQSPRLSRDLKKSQDISTYIHLERVIPLLVNQSWALVMSNLNADSNKPSSSEPVKNTAHSADGEGVAEGGSDSQLVTATNLSSPREPLRVMDTKFAEILGILRRHFAGIPDLKCMSGVKIKILCTLRFESEPFNRIWGVDKTSGNSAGSDELPALYAVVISFLSSAPYGPIPKFRIPFLLGEPSKSSYPLGESGQVDIVPAQNGISEEDEDRFRAPVVIELEPRDPVPGLINVSIEANADNGQIICGLLQSVTVGIENMFLNASLPSDVQEDLAPEYYSDLFCALWEACGSTSSTGREVFSLKGGKGFASIYGTQSVKMMEVPAIAVIRSVERYMAPFVVSVIGQPLVDMVKDSGIIKDIVWKEQSTLSGHEASTSMQYLDKSLLQLKNVGGEDEGDDYPFSGRRMMGCFLVLIFLPPRFHLLFQLEVSNISTLVRIRTDHWPCLAYIDDYLEALFLT